MAALGQAAPRLYEFASVLLDQIRSAKNADEIRNVSIDLTPLADYLASAVFNIHLVGRSQVWADHIGAGSELHALRVLRGESSLAAAVLGETDFEPLPFQEAIDYFRSKTNLSPEEFARLSAAARAKGFTIADGSSLYVRSSINDLLDQALSDGMTLKEFQSQAADVLDSAGLSARTPWYWETVYRTNLQTSYQVGRWKQITDPDTAKEYTYLRYISALLPTSRPSHKEKGLWGGQGVVLPFDHPFWSKWYPPNGFNCYCTTQILSDLLLKRYSLKVTTSLAFAFLEPDEGFGGNAGKSAAV